MSSQQSAILFDYPERAAFGRAVPKTRIEAHCRPGPRVRAALTAEVARIVWQYKLAPETVNLPARTGVAEIQNLRIELKTGIIEPSFDVLRCIDRAIGSPIIFECWRGDGMVCTVAAYKRPSDADRHKWVIGDYFAGAWTPAGTTRQPLPVALDLAGLYTGMLRQLMPRPAREGETLEAQAERLDQLRKLDNERRRIETRMARQQQFNRKVELNHQLKTLKAEIDQLAG